MSIPNHPTSNIEDAFSLNFLDFISASPDYVPTSPGKTYFSSSNSFGVVPIASPSLSLFHNDPYMNVLQAFYAKDSPIPPPNPITPPVILTPSSRKCGRPITHMSHKSKYSIHPGSNKIYQDLEKFYLLSSRGVVLEISRRVKGGNYNYELEALGELGDAVSCLDHMREIVQRDSVKLVVSKQLLAGTQVGIGLKDSYVADMEENEVVDVLKLSFYHGQEFIYRTYWQTISLKTRKLVIQHEFIDTLGGSVYWVPRVFASVLPVLGTVYKNLKECISVYRKYASEADPKKNYSQVRSLNFRICGCKTCVVFDMVPNNTKYTLSIFDMEHNNELDRFEYKHLSKAERKLTYAEQLFIIKASNANIRAVRAHNLYTGLKVVTDQDKAMRLAVAAEFRKSKHRLCMWHIMQKIPSKIVSRIYDETNFKAKFACLLLSIKVISSVEGCDVCVIDEEKPKPKPVTAPEVINKESTSENVEEEEINLHQKVTRQYKVLYTKKMVRFPAIVSFLFALGFYVDTFFRYSRILKCLNEAIERLVIKASLIVDSYVHMLSTNEPKLTSFINKIKALKAKVDVDFPIVPSCTVSELVQEFMGVKKSDKVNVKNPSGVKTKGREKEKHIKGGREISMEKRKGNADVLYTVKVVSGGGDHGDGGSRDDGPGSVSV
uniref:MULE transposase domain-containing protein n=1 Tax=Tanacetum cinerariifolium TaxID=118510 RepID=A0A6L2NKZ1_TANCI|nr:hypothetical protein [Tanacetum cinerariifolium]